MEQRSAEWHDARKGKMTCSRMAEAIGYIGSRKRLWRELTGRVRHDHEAPNERMLNGVTFEPLALTSYELAMGVKVEAVGFIPYPYEGSWIGGSPDGLVEDFTYHSGRLGGVEVKCPVYFYDEIPDYYMPQMQGLMEVTNRNWWDFVVWTPNLMSVTRVQRSRKYWAELYELLCEFWTYVEADVEPPSFKRGTKPRITAAPHAVVLRKE